jgi:hypothetical protein
MFKTVLKLDGWQIEVLKTLLSACTGLAVGWFVTYKWQAKQKKREADSLTAKSFYELYGESFAVWKLWEFEFQSNYPDESRRLSLLERACLAEGRMEAVLVAISCERPLTPDQVKTLGMFRQGYQTMRESIRDNKRIDWPGSEDRQYHEFKKLASKLGALLVDSNKDRSKQLLEITSNDWEAKWRALKS